MQFDSMILIHFGCNFNSEAFQDSANHHEIFLLCWKVSKSLFAIQDCFKLGVSWIDGQSFQFDPLQFIIISF